MNGSVLVSIVDDDESVRESLSSFLRSAGYAAAAFDSGEELLSRGDLERTRCLIVDVSMPRMSGPDLEAELHKRGISLPIVFITARNEPGLSERLCQRGAIACLIKPFTDDALLEAVMRATGEGG